MKTGEAMRRIVRGFLILWASMSTVPAVRAAFIADLGADWSDVNNPNTASFGSWSYLQGTTLLPHVANWTGLGAATPQPAWAPGNASGDSLPSEFKATSDQSGFNVVGQTNWKVGDVITHTTDPNNGVGNGPANYLWTSPINGTVTISGDAFEARVTPGRNNIWSLIVNAALSGTLLQPSVRNAGKSGGDSH